ncbi:5915_t:CDS:2 [Diversispora eburnea]|uniref:5915_t:CDS:1 n=1 Tax=Diversispora eburnea TaxID=1213867 RepID=A0A9N9GE03_9GLOM|nr:5915_t:CDS:2 [Diversispora eburnea]
MLDEDSMQDIDISINDLSPVSVQTIVCIFQKAIRSGQDTILYWYHFAGKYDKRIDEVSVSNKVDKKKATSLVYHEIKHAVGIEKIKQVSYNANSLSNFSYTQIQNIINYVLRKQRCKASNEQTSNLNILLTKKTLEETEVNEKVNKTEVNISIESQSLVLSSNEPSPKNNQDLKFSGTKIQVSIPDEDISNNNDDEDGKESSDDDNFDDDETNSKDSTKHRGIESYKMGAWIHKQIPGPLGLTL